MITLSQIKKDYGQQEIFNEVNLYIGSKDRLGIVGKNGTGKSTLLKLIIEEIKPDKGKITKTKNLRIGYLPQEILSFTNQSILELVTDNDKKLKETEFKLKKINIELAQKKEKKQLFTLIKSQEKLISTYENLGGYNAKLRAFKILNALGFKEHQFNQNIKKFIRRMAHAC